MLNAFTFLLLVIVIFQGVALRYERRRFKNLQRTLPLIEKIKENMWTDILKNMEKKISTDQLN